MTVRILQGNCRDVLPTLAAESVQACVTSPPYYGLRDYGVAGQIGLEQTPDEYILTMVEVFRAVRRVLRDDGTLWLNMGDSYSSGNSGQRVRDSCGGFQPGLDTITQGSALANPGRAATEGLAPKQLLMMPARLALALQADGWWLRSDIIWAKPNPMPESCRDRCTSAHEHIFMLTKAPRYFFDADAIAEPASWSAKMPDGWDTGPGAHGTMHRNGREAGANNGASGSTRACRNIWTIATEAFSAAHFATFPTELAVRCIRAGTSERGCCAHCGKPWVRETERTTMVIDRSERTHPLGRTRASGTMLEPPTSVTIGWSPGCGCGADVVPCTVLDPFAGAGTTLLVADRLQRNAIGIELNPAYVAMAERRIASDAPLFGTMLPPVADAEAIYDRQTDLFAAAAD